ncbi:coiled-coil domain-containing protein [Rhizomonospora bruguierae]|uniref:coiled-coil domain-containing protein n=1 Tax=Rhizomonospora bruguierae TaxID=1581705 RepID=UPI001BCDA1F3|nr:hypothetical protein [Micromonospora sp. NBRC 107566]
MRQTAPAHRRTAALLALLAALLVLAPLAAGGTPALAEPNGTTAGTDDEGGTKNLRQALEAANRGWLDAKAALEQSKKKQIELQLKLSQVQQRLDGLMAGVGQVAVNAYRSGRIGVVSALLNSASPDDFLQRATGLEMLARYDDNQLRKLTEAREEAARAKAAIDAELAKQRKQVDIMAKKKKDAERALGASSGASGGFLDPNSPLAKAAPRNSDGSWPSESCTVNDPTTSGCITPRTLHAMQQAKAAGYKRYVSCFRSGGGGEHPKGRACDFSAAANGFKDENATGGDRTYGNSLAAYFVKNASRLGVLYVIWYRQIWQPSTGWRSYSGSGGPAATHTNHVHLSMI